MILKRRLDDPVDMGTNIIAAEGTCSWIQLRAICAFTIRDDVHK
jgi:hypothetical protein